VNDAEIDLLVLPEFFATGYQFIARKEVDELSEKIPGGRTTEFLVELSRKKNCFIAAGLPEREGGRFFNSAVLTGPDGFIGSYRKTHLYHEEKALLNRQDRVQGLEHSPRRIGMMICFDWPSSIDEDARPRGRMSLRILPIWYHTVLRPCRPGVSKTGVCHNRKQDREKTKEGCSLQFIGQSRIVSPDECSFRRRRMKKC
jgi:hypothetical protein